MTTQTVQSAGPVVMPRVNLMPPEIAEAARLHRLQRGMVGAVVISAVIIGGLYWHAKQGAESAHNDLAAAQTQNTALQAKYNNLNDVQQVFNQVQAKRELVSEAMGDQVSWSVLLNDLTTAVPNNVWLTGFTAVETAVPGAAAGPPAVGADGTTTGIGTLTFSGVAFTHDDVSNWLDSQARVKGLADPSFQSSSKDAIGARGVVKFSSSVVLNAHALSNRYTIKAGS